jgi:tRNA modification GTPase
VEEHKRETIYALASGAAKSAVAVVRLSGAEVKVVLRLFTKCEMQPRVAKLGSIFDPGSGQLIDRGILLWFPGPRSFTGEDCLELHVHGSRAVLAALYRALGSIPGLRPARPGEFARRALENGKFDLIALESLADLIDAETEEQRRLAVVQGSGSLRSLVEGLRLQLIELMAIVETDLDFADEGDCPAGIPNLVKNGLAAIAGRLTNLCANYRCVERLRDGLTVLIAGPPNAGKSSLLNALARRDVAIVSEHAGTTRDLIEVRLDLEGFPVNVIDTAGIRLGEDPVEREGVRRAIHKSQSADLVLWLFPAGEERAELPKELEERPVWYIQTKSDLGGLLDDNQVDLVLSVLTGQNVGVLIQRLKNFAKENMSLDDSVLVANERQRIAVNSAIRALEGAKAVGLPLEIVAEELRGAVFALESLIGKVGVEDVLDSLFARFCIGK